MNIELTFGDVVKYLEAVGYNDDDILVMTKEPFYSFTKRQLEAYISAHQDIATANNIFGYPMEPLGKSR